MQTNIETKTVTCALTISPTICARAFSENSGCKIKRLRANNTFADISYNTRATSNIFARSGTNYSRMNQVTFLHITRDFLCLHFY
jgi:hypothetical protein